VKLNLQKKNKALLCNIIIFVLEIIGLVISLHKDGKISLSYYTNDSNLLMLLGSGLYILYSVKGNIPKWLKHFKYICVTALTITIVTVIFVLAPMYNFNYGWILFKDQMLLYHTLCPILAIWSFIKYEDYKYKDVMPPILYTLIYAVILIALNLYNIVDGPYPFLRVNSQSTISSIIWLCILTGANYLLAHLLLKYNHKIQTK
jgi:hypothetical protein